MSNETQSIQTTSTDKISKALALAQSKFKQPELNRKAEIKKDGKLLYTTEYADLNQCIECIRESLTANELSFSQSIELIGGAWTLVLNLRHSSGQILQSFMPLSAMSSGNAQTIGGQITYFKRYQISAFFGLAADFDDDGNAAASTYNEIDYKKSRAENRKENQANKNQNQDKAPQNLKPNAEPLKVVMPIGYSKGLTLGEIDLEVLGKAIPWIQSEINKKPNNMAQLMQLLLDVKEAHKIKMAEPLFDDTEQMPENSPNAAHSDEDPFDYVIPAGLFQTEGVDGLPLIKIPEAKIRVLVKEIDSLMSKPADLKGITISELFNIQASIKSFLKQVSP